MELDAITFGLSILIVFGLLMISGLIYHIIDMNDQLNKEITSIEDKIPKCPECPACPNCDVKCAKCESNCPKCPKCPEHPTCPECPQGDNCPKCTEGTECPACPVCQQTDCPSVDEIVSGVFPGRNPKVMSDSRYYDISPANSVGGLSSTNFYNTENKFPNDPIIPLTEPIRNYNNSFDSDLLNNSYDNNDINGSESQELTK